MNPDDKLKSMGTQSKETLDQAASAAHSAIYEAKDKVASKVEEIRSQAAPMIEKVSDAASTALTKARETWHDASGQVRERALKASDIATDYAKDEPMKAMLIAGATGAVLMGLLSMMARSRD